MAKRKVKLSRGAREYLREIGARGGSVKGKTKIRGTREHYRSIALARWGGKPSH